ncbi:PLP-dependent aminotransferase family protein [Halomicronema hongdechloris C2206]|uniref:PLP-dependent aminotransferase family protein n=1 Tax=Halomicronema hongdechloris C2206 TaxID=1641165 RepID=A0A1Z3HSF7_9CYAN|nr:PLP-dependent aminotransferase family protein [Halomicronema hongdechloris]ASC73243.1 PLP-dependent aminotransferase family protein [Halomicronema hongdechloris C2206]
MRLSPLEPSQDKVLYQQVADRLQEQIANGTLKPGDRLPSIRKLKQQLSVSFSTVTEAYRLLEDRGLISARPQSGYYVKLTALQQHLEPSLTEPYARVCEIKTSLTFKLFSNLLEPDVIQLGAATPSPEHLPVAPLNRLMAKVMREHPEAHTYNVPAGCERLRTEVSKRMLDAGCSIHPDHLLITNGAHEAIYLSLQAVTTPGDTIAIASPTYFALLETLKALNLKVCALPTHPRQGISLSHLEAALASGNVQACLLVSNFSHPLGTCMEDDTKKQLVELMTRYQVPLIEDDVYGELYFEGTRPKAIKAFDTDNRVIYCSSVSKTLSPGLRLGWCSGGCYHLKVVYRKSVMNRMSAIAPQLAVTAFLANGGYDRHLRHLRRTYQTQMHRMLQAICDYFPAETCVTHPHGGHVLWLEMPEGFDAIQLYDDALQRGISIAPGPIFSASGECYRSCFALNTALPWSDRIEQAMQTLGHLAKKQMAVNF